MQQIFVKSFAGTDVEFNRLLFPVRYKILIRIDNENPVELVLGKMDGHYQLLQDGSQLDGWVHNIIPGITEEIIKNEEADQPVLA